METIETLRFAITYIDVKIFSFSKRSLDWGDLQFFIYIVDVVLSIIVNLPYFQLTDRSWD